MWAYVVNSLAWSAVGLFGSAVLAELGYDLHRLISRGRLHRDDT